jgi:hypothetical protein
MATFQSTALRENTGLIHLGEPAAKSATLPAKLAVKLIDVRNPHGKPNADVLRQFVTFTDPRRPILRWQIDFPSDMGEHEASLYEQPFRELRRLTSGTPHRWWVNPHANSDLRTALARRDRYLAAPINSASPTFLWLESSLIPEDALVAIARDDDFAQGVLSSRFFARWWACCHSPSKPTLALNSFPFPWPVQTPLSSLTSAQEENRHAVAKAARTGNAESINATAAAAYGWADSVSDDEAWGRLRALNQKRSQL